MNQKKMRALFGDEAAAFDIDPAAFGAKSDTGTDYLCGHCGKVVLEKWAGGEMLTTPVTCPTCGGVSQLQT